ncbi:SigE family RNA polymerase sigma factor [Nocardioides dongxiaopingii]|uniref:SigE family RNA polymerase sigma factor n=1 Tax=Nocardioides sp. S-1144 TaxID=2582905 RepID=UPI00110F4872|nr:SigE family RNA polymerase sigma factor [Nocardioides sp. S-1144]QCW49500.1 SigE family RNA polymerase sigma factor [Nocardioides sp. S-1144]
MGSDDDFTEFAAARWPRLLRSAIVLGCSPEEAEDLVQSTLLRCYTSWSKVRRADNRDAYVATMLLNTFRGSRRRHWWGERPSDHLPDVVVADPSDAVVVTDSVVRSLTGLTVKQREVVVLRYYAQLSEKETAAALGIAPGTVKSRLSAALRHLATTLEPTGEH